MSYDLPDGITESMIPGNSHEDMLYDKWFDDNMEALAREFLEEDTTVESMVEALIDASLYEDEFRQYCSDKFAERGER